MNYADHYWSTNPAADPRPMTLATYMVTSPADSGPGTWRDAVGQSNRRIIVAAPLVVVLASAITTAANNLVIEGRGNLTVTRRATKFEGTGIVLSGVQFYDCTASADEDCVTFRTPAGVNRVQAFTVEDCTFNRAADGGLDIIWNHGNDVYATVRRCTFLAINKACLVHSGTDAMEGGRYHVTFMDNLWSDCYQRMPMARDADVHIVRDHYHRFGEGGGGGGGAKAARGSQFVVEDITVTPRRVGEVTFDGVTVTKPRIEAVGPHLSTPTGAVRATGSPHVHVTQDIPDPVYARA